MKKLIITVIFVFALFLSIFAQNAQTPYQKKQFELAKKYFQIFYGYQMTMSESVFFEELAEGKEVRDFLLGLGILSYAMEHSEAQVEYVLAQMEKEYKAAEKLKNETDFRLEKEAKDLKAKKEYENTDVGAIRKNVKSDFEKWNQRGEFEKECDYEKRLERMSQMVFDSICIKQILHRVNTNLYFKKKQLLRYNLLDEYFTLFFEINNIEYQSNINVPIDQAEDFKNDFNDINFKVDDYDLVYVGNRLCPTFLTIIYPNNAKFRGKPKYKFPVTHTNATEITLPFDSLEIDNKYLNGYVFKLSEAKVIAKQRELERQRLDSLELASFNNQLDSIYNDYNNRLLQNPYNRTKATLKDYANIDSFTDKDSRKYEFNRRVSNMKLEFERLNEQFETMHKYEYNKNGKLFDNKAQFDKFYIQDDSTYLSEVEKRTKINYLKSKSGIIEAMDFQKENKPTIVSEFISSYTGYYTDYAQKNAERNEILSFIKKNENKTYFPQIIDFVIEKNIGLNKEWNKNGHFFENKTEFYKAFISENYKNILKVKKKNKK
ncbi:MAG: hypothetical protein IK025_13630 [Bacteroidales bacterium]|nr:hypothetical protein [Bacteroidales bacterium]